MGGKTGLICMHMHGWIGSALQTAVWRHSCFFLLFSGLPLPLLLLTPPPSPLERLDQPFSVFSSAVTIELNLSVYVE